MMYYIRIRLFDFLGILCYVLFMVVEQVIDLPASRRVILDLPQAFPVGKIHISVFPVPLTAKISDTASGTQEAIAVSSSSNNEKIRFTKQELDEMVKNSPTLHKISGILSQLGDVDLDEVRKARLAKHL